MKINDNIKKLVDLLSQENDFITANELKNKYNLDNTIQSLNASLSASIYNNILFTKTKKVVNDKMLTAYKLVANYQDTLNDNKGE